MKYHFKVHKEKNGFWAECIELQGCQTQGESLDELKKNMKEVLELYLDEPYSSNAKLSLPDKTLKGRNIIEVAIDPPIAFITVLRYYRQLKSLTQSDVAKLLNKKSIFSYQRLESSKIDPKLSTLSEIKKVFPEISIDDILQQ